MKLFLMTHHTATTHSAQSQLPNSVAEAHQALHKQQLPSTIYPLITITLIALPILAIIIERIVNISLHRARNKLLYIICGVSVSASIPFLYQALQSVRNFEKAKKQFIDKTFADLEAMPSTEAQTFYLSEIAFKNPGSKGKKWLDATKQHFLTQLKNKLGTITDINKKNLMATSLKKIEKDISNT